MLSVCVYITCYALGVNELTDLFMVASFSVILLALLSKFDSVVGFIDLALSRRQIGEVIGCAHGWFSISITGPEPSL